MCQLPATLCVALSLALVALGGSDLTRRVSPLKSKLWQTTRQSWDPFWIRLPMSKVRKIIFTMPFTMPVEPSSFAYSVVTSRGYKAGGHSSTTYIFSHDLPLPPRLRPYG
jgi:hypothetical protein